MTKPYTRKPCGCPAKCHCHCGYEDRITDQVPATEAYFLRDEETKWTLRRALVRRSDGVEIAWDGGEPEDATFTRDYAPVVDELNRLAEDRLTALELAEAVLEAME